MNQQELNSFLANMFESRVEFANINGSTNSMNADYMLVADAVSENVELLAETLKEHFENQLSSFTQIKQNQESRISNLI